MEKQTLYEFPDNINTYFMFPNSAFMKDFDSKKIDTAKHPVIFVVDNYGSENSYGFRGTSNPQGSDLESFFFVYLHNGEDFENSDKKDVAIHCDHLIVFDKYLDHSFGRRGNIISERYEEIMTTVITKHILLRNEGLTTHDPYTEYLLLELGLDLEKDMYKIKQSPLYGQLRDELYATDKPYNVRKTRKKQIEEQREKIKNMENKKK